MLTVPQFTRLRWNLPDSKRKVHSSRCGLTKETGLAMDKGRQWRQALVPSAYFSRVVAPLGDGGDGDRQDSELWDEGGQTRVRLMPLSTGGLPGNWTGVFENAPGRLVTDAAPTGAVGHHLVILFPVGMERASNSGTRVSSSLSNLTAMELNTPPGSSDSTTAKADMSRRHENVADNGGDALDLDVSTVQGSQALADISELENTDPVDVSARRGRGRWRPVSGRPVLQDVMLNLVKALRTWQQFADDDDDDDDETDSNLREMRNPGAVSPPPEPEDTSPPMPTLNIQLIIGGRLVEVTVSLVEVDGGQKGEMAVQMVVHGAAGPLTHLAVIQHLEEMWAKPAYAPPGHPDEPSSPLQNESSTDPPVVEQLLPKPVRPTSTHTASPAQADPAPEQSFTKILDLNELSEDEVLRLLDMAEAQLIVSDDGDVLGFAVRADDSEEDEGERPPVISQRDLQTLSGIRRPEDQEPERTTGGEDPLKNSEKPLFGPQLPEELNPLGWLSNPGGLVQLQMSSSLVEDAAELDQSDSDDSDSELTPEQLLDLLTRPGCRLVVENGDIVGVIVNEDDDDEVEVVNRSSGQPAPQEFEILERDKDEEQKQGLGESLGVVGESIARGAGDEAAAADLSASSDEEDGEEQGNNMKAFRAMEDEESSSSGQTQGMAFLSERLADALQQGNPDLYFPMSMSLADGQIQNGLTGQQNEEDDDEEEEGSPKRGRRRKGHASRRRRRKQHRIVGVSPADVRRFKNTLLKIFSGGDPTEAEVHSFMKVLVHEVSGMENSEAEGSQSTVADGGIMELEQLATAFGTFRVEGPEHQSWNANSNAAGDPKDHLLEMMSEGLRRSLGRREGKQSSVAGDKKDRSLKAKWRVPQASRNLRRHGGMRWRARPSICRVRKNGRRVPHEDKDESRNRDSGGADRDWSAAALDASVQRNSGQDGSSPSWPVRAGKQTAAVGGPEYKSIEKQHLTEPSSLNMKNKVVSFAQSCWSLVSSRLLGLRQATKFSSEADGYQQAQAGCKDTCQETMSLGRLLASLSIGEGRLAGSDEQLHVSLLGIKPRGDVATSGPDEVYSELLRFLRDHQGSVLTVVGPGHMLREVEDLVLRSGL